MVFCVRQKYNRNIWHDFMNTNQQTTTECSFQLNAINRRVNSSVTADTGTSCISYTEGLHWVIRGNYPRDTCNYDNNKIKKRWTLFQPTAVISSSNETGIFKIRHCDIVKGASCVGSKSKRDISTERFQEGSSK
jgi:hypothetical protein